LGSLEEPNPSADSERPLTGTIASRTIPMQEAKRLEAKDKKPEQENA